MVMTPEQLHELGMALATLEEAIGSTPDAFRTGGDHAQVVGDGAVYALAMRGFIVEYDPVRAAVVMAEYEREPEQAPRLQ